MFCLLSTLIISTALFLGGGIIGLSIVILLWCYIIRTRLPITNQTFKDNYKKRNSVWLKIVFYYPLSIIGSLSLVIYTIFDAFNGNTRVSSYLYDGNLWFSSLMYEHIPTIQEQVDLSKVRGDVIWEYYKTFYSQAYGLMFLLLAPIFLNTKTLFSAAIITHKNKDKGVTMFWVNIVMIIFPLLMFFLILDQPEISESRHPHRHYNSQYNDRHFYKLPFSMLIGVLTTFCATATFQNISNFFLKK